MSQVDRELTTLCCLQEKSGEAGCRSFGREDRRFSAFLLTSEKWFRP